MAPKIKASFILFLMFGLGVMTGIAWQTYQTQHAVPPTKYASRPLQQLKGALALSATQEQALQQIFDDAHQRARQINEEVAWDLADVHEDSLKAIHGVLTPEQNHKFDRIHERSVRRAESPHVNEIPAQLHNGDATS